jgi:hypothetical protein
MDFSTSLGKQNLNFKLKFFKKEKENVNFKDF